MRNIGTVIIYTTFATIHLMVNCEWWRKKWWIHVVLTLLVSSYYTNNITQKIRVFFFFLVKESNKNSISHYNAGYRSNKKWNTSISRKQEIKHVYF